MKKNIFKTKRGATYKLYPSTLDRRFPSSFNVIDIQNMKTKRWKIVSENWIEKNKKY